MLNKYFLGFKTIATTAIAISAPNSDSVLLFWFIPPIISMWTSVWIIQTTEGYCRVNNSHTVYQCPSIISSFLCILQIFRWHPFQIKHILKDIPSKWGQIWPELGSLTSTSRMRSSDISRHFLLLLSLHLNSIFGEVSIILYMTHSQMLGKVEYGGGPIFKVVLEC